jgi:hypothetical protein
MHIHIHESPRHESQKITDQKGSAVFESEMAGTKGIKFWNMSWGPKALVLEPDKCCGHPFK